MKKLLLLTVLTVAFTSAAHAGTKASEQTCDSDRMMNAEIKYNSLKDEAKRLNTVADYLEKRAAVGNLGDGPKSTTQALATEARAKADKLTAASKMEDDYVVRCQRAGYED